eukprot:scaffold339910_cov18-Prasinocladus_malaysianus.AAC.1
MTESIMRRFDICVTKALAKLSDEVEASEQKKCDKNEHSCNKKTLRGHFPPKDIRACLTVTDDGTCNDLAAVSKYLTKERSQSFESQALGRYDGNIKQTNTASR